MTERTLGIGTIKIKKPLVGSARRDAPSVEITAARNRLIQRWNAALETKLLISENEAPDIWVGALDRHHQRHFSSIESESLSGGFLNVTAAGKAVILLKKRALDLTHYSLGKMLLGDANQNPDSVTNRAVARKMSGPSESDIALLKQFMAEDTPFWFQEIFRKQQGATISFML